VLAGLAALAGVPVAMVRGGTEKRTRLVAVRVTPAEWAAWDERRAASGRREMGAWVRAVVNEAERVPARSASPRRAGDVPVVPEVNREVRGQLARAGNNLNQLARAVNAGATPATGTVVEEIRAAVDEVAEAARAVYGRMGPRR